MSIHAGYIEVCEIVALVEGVETNICEVALGTIGVFGCPAAPTVQGVGVQYTGGTYQFKLADFTTGFSDPDGDSYLNLKLTKLPPVGTISYLGTPVTADQVIPMSGIGNLVFDLPAGYKVTERGYIDDQGQAFNQSRLCVSFQVSDDSESNLYSTEVETCLLLTSGNGAPTVQDNSGNLVANEFIFDPTSFTNGFSDPNGDSYGEVNIKSAPTLGKLYYSGAVLVAGTSFQAADSSNLKYVLPDRYAVYEGAIYDFGRSAATIVSEYEALGYELITNADGIMNFSDSSNNTFKTVEGILVESALNLTFTIKDDLGMESDPAVFTLVPTGNINAPAPSALNATVDDININTKQGVVTVITVEMVDAAYKDPQGDNWIELRIDAIKGTNTGEFRVNEIPIFAEQIIPRTAVVNRTFTHLGTVEGDFKTDSISISVRDNVNGPWVN